MSANYLPIPKPLARLLEAEAVRRGTKRNALALQLLSVIAHENLFDAVLDETVGPVDERHDEAAPHEVRV